MPLFKGKPFERLPRWIDENSDTYRKMLETRIASMESRQFLSDYQQDLLDKLKAKLAGIK